MADTRSKPARPGDVVVVTGHRVGDTQQLGEILEVLGDERPHYRVRWEDGHESMFFPGSDATVEPRRRARSKARP